MASEIFTKERLAGETELPGYLFDVLRTVAQDELQLHDGIFVYGSFGGDTPMVMVTPDANYGDVRRSYFNDADGKFNFEDFFFKGFIPS